MEVNFRPSVPDNVNHWQVFRDDKQILKFIHNVQKFSGCKVGYKEKGKEYREEDDPIQNSIPKGLVALEQIFDRQDKHKKEEAIKLGDYIEINIGRDEDPKMLKIGKRNFIKRRKKTNKSCPRV